MQTESYLVKLSWISSHTLLKGDFVMETETVALDFLVTRKIDPEIEARMEKINRELDALESELGRLISERKRKHQKVRDLKEKLERLNKIWD